MRGADLVSRQQQRRRRHARLNGVTHRRPPPRRRYRGRRGRLWRSAWPAAPTPGTGSPPAGSATDWRTPVNRPDRAKAGMGQLLSMRASGFTSPAVVSAIRDEVNLLALCRQIPQRATPKAAAPADAAPAAPPRPAPTTAPCGPPTPNTSVASARIVPGDPSGSSTTNSSTPFHRLNDRAANKRPNNGCVSATTRTSHGNTARNCCSLSPSLSGSAKPMWHKHSDTA